MSRKILVKGCLVVWQPAQRDSGCLECRCAGCRKCRGGQHPKRDVFHVAFRVLRGGVGVCFRLFARQPGCLIIVVS